MDDEYKLEILEEAKSHLESAIGEMQCQKIDFSYYIDLIQTDINEIDKEISELEEKQNKVWNKENRDLESEYINSQL